MGAMISQITSLTIVYSTVYSGADQSSVSLPFVWGIHWWPVNSPHKGPVTWKMTPFDDVTMDFAVITMPADDPVLLSAGISATTDRRVEFAKGPVLEGLLSLGAYDNNGALGTSQTLIMKPQTHHGNVCGEKIT